MAFWSVGEVIVLSLGVSGLKKIQAV
jgi:hypothetical protein